MRKRISKTLQKAKRRCRARRNSCLQREADEAKYRPRGPGSKQVWKEPKLVSLTLSSLLLCLCINNRPLFMAVPHRTPYTRACGVTSEDGADLAALGGA